MATKKPEEDKPIYEAPVEKNTAEEKTKEINATEENSEEKKTKGKEPEKKTKIQKEYPKNKGDLVYYIGPTVKRGLLDHGSMFRGLPKEIEGLQKEHPEIKPLFIVKKEYIKAITQVKVPGTRFNILYENAKKSLEKNK